MTPQSLTGKPNRATRRRDRYSARNVLWLESSLPRVRRCGLGTNATSHDAMAGGQRKRAERLVSLRVTRSETGNAAGFSGVESCGSTWACPVCAEKIQAHRQAEVATAIATARARGWHVGFLTFTVRHRRKHDLADVWAAVSTAWRATVSGSREAWDTDRYGFGVEGYLRLTEVTHGVNGWHVHIHALVFLNPQGITRTRRTVTRACGKSRCSRLCKVWEAETGGTCKQVTETVVTVAPTYDPSKPYAAVQALGERMADRWRGALAGTDFRPGRKHGHDSRLVTSDSALPEYFAKNLYAVKGVESAAFDVTGSHAKQAKRGNVTPFGILARIVNPVDVDKGTGELRPAKRDVALWHEWERASKGKRQLLWSNGLRDTLGLRPEVADEDVAESDALDGDVVLQLRGTAYRRLARSGRVCDLLEAAETDPTGHRARDLLLLFAVPWVIPDESAEWRRDVLTSRTA